MKTFKDLKTFLQEAVEIKPLSPKYTNEDAKALQNSLGLEFVNVDILLKDKARKPNQVCAKELVKGLNHEREHDDLTGGDLLSTAKIVMSHLREVPDYYTRLVKIEK